MTHAMSAPVGAERAEELLAAALAASDADALEVFVAGRTASVLRFAGARVHQPQDLSAVQVMVRAVVGRSAARAATSSVRDVARIVEHACRQARELEKSGGGARAGVTAHQPAAPAVAERGCGLWCEGTAAWDAGARAEQVNHAVAAAHAHDTEINGTLTAAVTELAVANTSEVNRYAAATEAGISMTVRSGAGSSHYEDIGRSMFPLGIDAAIDATVERAVRMADPEGLEPGRYDVVFGPLAAGELVSFFPAFGFTAPALRAGVGLAARADRVLSPLVTIADDATRGPGLPFPFDMEGTDRRRVAMVVGGVPGDVVSDLATADVTGGSTGHAHIAREESPAPVAANLRLEPRSGDTAALVSGVGRGVYVERLWYTRVVDAESGTIAGTTRDAAWRIEDGRLTTPLAGCRFSESVLDAFARIDAIGTAIGSHPLMNVWNGCVSAPSIRVRGFRLGLPAQSADEGVR